MTEKIHEIFWKGRFNKTGKDITFFICEKNCLVHRVSHPIVKWAIGDAWCRVYSWLIKKNANIKDRGVHPQ